MYVCKKGRKAMNTICLIENDKELNKTLKFYLEKADYTVYGCLSLSETKQNIDKNIDIWVVDLMLPDGNGLKLVRNLKESAPDSCVVVMSDKADKFDRVAGFEMGCDDYVAKPFLPAELVYRVNKLARITNQFEQSGEAISPISPYLINPAKRVISINGKRLDITSKEFDVILYFIAHRGEALSRNQLLVDIWGSEYTGSNRIVDNFVKNIRKKLALLNIETIYGYGYRFN